MNSSPGGMYSTFVKLHRGIRGSPFKNFCRALLFFHSAHLCCFLLCGRHGIGAQVPCGSCPRALTACLREGFRVGTGEVGSRRLRGAGEVQEEEMRVR